MLVLVISSLALSIPLLKIQGIRDCCSMIYYCTLYPYSTAECQDSRSSCLTAGPTGLNISVTGFQPIADWACEMTQRPGPEKRFRSASFFFWCLCMYKADEKPILVTVPAGHTAVNAH